MIKCPKCSSWEIRGPRYERREYGGECLRFTCGRCGYSEVTDVHDRDGKEHPFAQAIAQKAKETP